MNHWLLVTFRKSVLVVVVAAVVDDVVDVVDVAVAATVDCRGLTVTLDKLSPLSIFTNICLSKN